MRRSISPCHATLEFLEPRHLLSASAAVSTINDAATIAFTGALSATNGAELIRDNSNRYIVTPGSTVQLSVFTDDLRDIGASGGVFSAFTSLEIEDENGVAKFLGPLEYGVGFDLARSGNLTATSISNGGALRSTLTPPGSDPKQLLYSVELSINVSASTGDVVLIRMVPDSSAEQQNLAFGSSLESPASYEDLELVIMSSPWRNSAMAADVNADGKVSASDVRSLVNAFLQSGVGYTLSPPTVLSHPPSFLDVSGDNRVSQADLALIVNHLLSMTPAVMGESAIADADTNMLLLHEVWQDLITEDEGLDTFLAI